MAQRVEQPAGSEDLEILHPERTIHLANRDITVREYGFVDGLRLRARYQPFVTALGELMQRDPEITMDTLQGLLAEHLDDVTALVCAAADISPEFFEGLTDIEGELLMATWWEVNGPFFVRRLGWRLIGQNNLMLVASPAPDSPTSTPS